MLYEGKNIEFKREYTEDIKKTVIAFANTDGGKIYIGIEDSGNIVGVSDIDRTMLSTANTLRDSIRPDVTLFVEYNVETIENKNVIIINVQRGTARPYYLLGKGIRSEGVFVRQGASTVPATDTAILNMIKETSGDHYENNRSINQDLTFEKTTEFFQKRALPFENPQKKTLHLIDKDDTYTNLALLLSDQCPHIIKAAVFDGSLKTIFRDRNEFSGSMLNQLEEAYKYIDYFNHTRAEFKGLDRIDMRDYPPEAVREALLNAVIHRDYSVSAAILISIFDDRIEIVTIGGLVKGVSFDDIMLGVSVLRNHNLANVFYRLKLIEAYGTGIQKVMNNYHEYSTKPKIEVSDNAFKITLPNTNYASNDISHVYSERESQIVSILKSNSEISRKEVEQELQISQATAIRLLKDMTDKGIISKVRNGKFMKYRLGK